MPQAPYRPCRHAGCAHLVKRGEQCPVHPTTAGWSDKQRGTRHQRGYGSKWDKLRKVVLARDEGLCCAHRRAGQLVAGNHVDHIVNKATWLKQRGTLAGCDDPSNLQTLCPTCHRGKTQAEANGVTWHEPGSGMSTSSASPLVRVGFLRL